ncbi:MAG: hypothetical protein IBX63_10905, partial [Coriobacteriia bacterium]|nr:hypothetical protein [Coriobacteriia bacterium]
MADDTGIRPRGDTWQVRVSYKDPLTGQERELSATARTKTEARAKRRELLERRDKGLALGGGNETLAAYLTRWLEECRRRGLSPSTTDGYKQVIGRHII